MMEQWNSGKRRRPRENWKMEGMKTRERCFTKHSNAPIVHHCDFVSPIFQHSNLPTFQLIMVDPIIPLFQHFDRGGIYDSQTNSHRGR